MEDAPLIVGHVQKTQEESITSTTNTWSVSSTSSWSASAREWLMRGGEGANRLTVRDTACELVGTCLIVLIGCTSVTAESGMGDTQIVMAFAGVVVAMVFCFDTLSGAHFNPAVTFTFLLLRQIGLVKACLYAAAQCTGAVLGAALVYWLVPNSMANHLGATVSVVSDWQCFVIEAIATSVLIGYVLMMAMHRSKPQPKRDLLPCGLWFLIVALNFFCARLTGCSMNPARSFGPAVVANYWKTQHIYWLGPFAGAVIATAFYCFVFITGP
eukprot:TRINITY_DN1896_c0_g1_i2.p1 TRINITY_DN1896_c0_g1~~TRINITY_DN1896_c0_g1_i2.p1  ORF type:complete len:280 (+),score=56.62 TRINITY_DN1896_c0_g1_i2:32-841(+)